MAETILQMDHIVKEFGGIRVLKDVSFDLKAGEIHGLIGENGAGKSTLIKVLGGVYHPEEGEIRIQGKKRELLSAKESLAAGVGIIYQEFNLVPSLSIAENIFLGNELAGSFWRLKRREMVAKANKLMEKLGFTAVDCGEKVSELSVAQQQMVEIAKALFHNSRILVMDEPTAVLTDRESGKLFEIIENLKTQGVGIIYVSHRLEEVLQLSDRITVLRDGSFVRELDNRTREVTKDQLVGLMVGRSLEQYYPERGGQVSGEVILEVEGLTRKDTYQDISFKLRRGEILGITGLVGAGRTEMVKSIFGAMRYDSGKIRLRGKPLQIHDPMEAIRQGIAYIPENRKEEGLFLDASIADNMIMSNYDQVSRKGILKSALKKQFLENFFSKLDIRPTDPEKIARDFSGGNQQKAIVAKWMAINPDIMILDEPTRGIDIGAKAEIYRLMNQLAGEGHSIIMVSSEMSEIIGMSDRVLVMAEGKISGEFLKGNLDQEKIMAASSQIVEEEKK